MNCFVSVVDLALASDLAWIFFVISLYNKIDARHAV